MRETWFGVLVSLADGPIIQIGIALIVGSFLLLGALHGMKLILGLVISIVKAFKVECRELLQLVGQLAEEFSRWKPDP